MQGSNHDGTVFLGGFPLNVPRFHVPYCFIMSFGTKGIYVTLSTV